jgi:tetratricopeptide (TPR) repeat protein
MRLAKIYYNKGDLETALDMIKQATKCVSNAPAFNRVDIPLCLEANYQLDDNESEKALSVLNNLDRVLTQEDVYSLLTRARVYYLKSVTCRHDPIEQSRRL